MKAFYSLRIICILFIVFCCSLTSVAQTSWKGTTSTAWLTVTNWTNGLPSTTVDAIIGDANFTGAFQPSLSGTSACNNLTIGGSVNATLSVSKSFTVTGNVIINPGGTITHTAGTVSLKGNWTNNGTYTGTSTSSTVAFTVTGKSINGTSTTNFQRLSINTSCITTSNVNTTVAVLLSVSGTFIPAENVTPVVVSGAGALTLGSSSTLKVNASTYAGNYTLSGAITLTAGNTIEYGATLVNQTISQNFAIGYSGLKISGALTKTLTENLLPFISTSTTLGKLTVSSGTLDLSTFTADRGTTLAGGTLTVSNGAILRIGGTNALPANYLTVTLGALSTVEYYGDNQTIAAKTYGNLTLTGTSGAVVKTFVATAFTIAGNFIANVGTASSLSFTAAAIITFTGNINIGISTTFYAGNFAHLAKGNWVNDGSVEGNTSTFTCSGTTKSFSGSGIYNFYNLTITGAGNTASATTIISIGGNLVTSGSGAFTHNAGGSLTMSGTTKTITGTGIVFSNLTCSGIITTANSFTVTGNLLVTGSLTASAGIITLSGTAKTLSGSGVIALYGLSVSGSVTTVSNFSINASLTVAGSFTASSPCITTFKGVSTLSGTANLFDVVINGTSLQLLTNAVLGIANTFTITLGSLNVTTTKPNTINYNGTVAQAIKNTAYHHLILSNGNTKTASGAITVNGDLTIAPSTTFAASSYTHIINGNWINNGAFIQGTSTISFAGAVDASISGTNTFNILTVSKTSSSNKVSLLNDVTVPTVNLTNGILNTGVNTLTITTTRTGPGIILGNIQRSHTFTTGVAYEFESPNNTITFSSVTGVSSITVKATIGPVAGFSFGSSINRQYDIVVPSGTYSATLRLHYEDGELNGNVESSMLTWHYNGSAWVAAGKSTNSTTSNYVEQTSLTDITNRWTLSDLISLVQWNGSVSTNWFTAANWTSLQGAPSLPPAQYDIAQIGTAAFTNQPSINGAATAKSILFGSAQAVTLDLVSGGSLTTQGGISGTWSSNATHTINVNNQTLTVNGDVALSDGTAGHVINLNISTGTVTIKGSLTESGGANVTFTGAGTLNIANDFNYVSGAFTAGTGKVVYNGTASQIVAAVAYNDLTVNKTTGISSLNNPATVAGNLLVSLGELDINAATSITGNVTISTGATLKNNGVTITVGGNWANTGTYIPSNGTTTFNGLAAQTISATTFNNLIVNKTSGTATLSGNLIINGDVNLNAGTLDLATYTCNRSSAGGILAVANNTTLKIGGTNTFPTNYTAVNLSVASNVQYSGTNQTVSNQPYGNLILSSSAGAATKTLPATPLNIYGNFTSTLGSGTSVSFTGASDITVNGNVTMGASTTFNGGAYSHNIGGNWTNNGTFTGNTSTVIFNGAGSAVSGSGLQNFNNLTIATSGITFSSGSINLTGNLSTTGSGSFIQASGGTLIMSGANKTITGTDISIDNLSVSGSVTTSTSLNITGNLSVSGSFTATDGTITMSGSSKTISGAGTKDFYTLSVSGAITTNASFSILSGLTVGGNLSASAGTATFTGTSTLSGTANLFNATINGTSLELSASTVLGIANVLTITSGILDVTSGRNTVNFNGTGSQNINAITYSDLLLSNGNTKTAVGDVTTLYDIIVGTGTTFNPSSYTHTTYGNWINNGTFIPGTSTIEFAGPATAYITGATTFNILTSNTSNATTELMLQSNVSAAIVNMTNGIIKTGSNTLTITNTRTGSGYIYGNIQRTHTFITGVAYEFEGPDNTITFSSVSGVSSITVNVVEGSISDFPFGGSISRVYNINIPAGTYNATLRLHYEDDELNGNDESTMNLWQYNGTSWGSIGKTANSTSANYVEQSGLTSITNRWTISDNSNVVQWNGSVSNDWNTAANWTVLEGSGSMPPSSTDIVDLGAATFINQPTISNNVTVKNIIFGSVKAVTLTLASGGSLTTMGDINGNWAGNATHAIDVNNQTLTVNGNLDLSDGTNGHAIDLNVGAGTVTILGSLSEAGGANITLSGAAAVTIFQDFDYTSGTFTAGASTLTYNGSENQDVGRVNYNNLVINKAAGIATIDFPLNVAADLIISSGQLDNFSTTTIAGNVTINPAGTLYNYQALHVGGNWNNNGTFAGIGASIYFDGSGTQTISASTFNNLIINKASGTAVLTGDIIINGDFNIAAGTFDFGTYNFTRAVLGGTASLADGAVAIIGGNNGPANFATKAIGVNSTIIYNGISTQYISSAGIDFGNVIFRNGGINSKVLITSASIKGNLTIEAGAVLNAASYTVALEGNWINSGTFTPTTSTVLLNGISKTISGATTFYKLTASGSYTYLSNLTFNNSYTVTSTANITAVDGTLTTVSGDFTNSGYINCSGSITYSGNVLQTLRLINAVYIVDSVNYNGSISPVLNSTSGPRFYNVNVNNTGGVTAVYKWIVYTSFTVGTGAIWNGAAYSHDIFGSVTNNGTITSSGTMSFIPATAVTVNLGNNFSSTGRVYFGGAGAMTLAGSPVSFSNVNINNTSSAGLSPSSDWTLTNTLRVVGGSILNAGNHSYFIGGNISSSGTINSGTSTFTLNGTGAQDINTLSPFNNLTVNKASGSTTLSTNATVNGAMNFIGGNIETGNNALMLSSSATLSGAAQNTGWVYGNLQKNIVTGATVKAFEIGDAVSYTPVTIAFQNVTTAGDLTVNTTPTDHPAITSSVINPNKSVNRFWTINNSGIAFTTYDATFNFVASDVDPGATTSAFKVDDYHNAAWSLPVTALANATNTQATGLTSFSDFAIGEVCNEGTTISYVAGNYCADAGIIAVTQTGTAGGTYTSTAGISLDAATGDINAGTSTAGSYLVTYTLDAAGGCPVYTTTANITINICKYYVNDNSNTGDVYTTAVGNDASAGSASAPFLTINHAISVVNAGDTIYVDAGTYGEEVTPNKAITLLGSNAAISPNTGTRVAESILNNPSGSAVTVNSVNRVVIKGFEITGNPGYSVKSNTTSHKITLEKNLIDTTWGLNFINPDSLLIIDNKIKRLVAGQEGIYIAGNYNGATGTYIEVYNNRFINGDMSGMNISGTKGNVYNNTFTALAYYGILVANYNNLNITQNLFKNIINPNVAVTTWGSGIRFYTPAAGTITNVTNNFFNNNYIGVAVRAAGGDLNGRFILVNNNSFTGNTYANINHEGTGVLSATCNWFGLINSCSSTFLPTILGNVAYSPYLTDGTDNDASTAGFQPVPGTCNGFIEKWIGTTSSDYNTLSNWTGGEPLIIPNTSVDIFMPTGLSNYPAITTGTKAVRNVVIESGASLLVNDGVLQVSGCINNTGIFDVTNGTVEMNGTSDQTIPAGAFTTNKIKNLVINNNVTLGGRDSITGVLSFGNTDGKTFTTGGFLTLKSSAIGSARVADITSGGINLNNLITGAVEIERYIPAHRAWRLLTSPTDATGSQTIHDAWQEGVNNSSLIYSANQNPVPGYGAHITKGTDFASGFDVGVNSNPSIKNYNNTTGAWDALSTTNIPITDYPAYMLFVRGNRSTNLSQGVNAPATNTILRSTGELKSGDQSYDVAATGFTVISNPFASAMDLNAVGKANSTNIQDNFYVWDPKITGSNGVGGFVTISWDPVFSVYTITPFTGDGISQYIQSGAGFLARSANGTSNGTLVVKETDKTAAGSDNVNRPQNMGGAQKLVTNLYSVNADGTTSIVDGLLNSYSTGYSNTVDNTDAVKLGNFSESISTLRNGVRLTVERRQPVTQADTIFFNMLQMRLKQYTFEFIAENLDNPGLTAFFEDNYLNTSTPVDLNATTSISFTVTNVAGAWAPDRFRIVFRPAAPLPVTINFVKAWQQNDAIQVEWKVENETGIKQYEVERSTDGLRFTKSTTVITTVNNHGAYSWLDANAHEGNNYYRIKTIDVNGTVHYSSVVKAYMGKGGEQIVLDTKIITNGAISFKLINMPAGKYGVRLLNDLGQVIYKKSIAHAAGSTEILQVKNHLLNGIYMLEFTKPDNKKVTEKVMVE